MAALPSIRYDKFEDAPIVGDYVVGRDGAAAFVASLEAIGDASATSLKNALLDFARDHSYGESLFVTRTPPESLDPDWSPREPVEFLVNGEERRLELHVVFETANGDEDEMRAKIAQLTRPMLERHRASLVSLELEGGDQSLFWRIAIAPSTRARPVADLVDLGANVEALLSRVHRDGLDQDSVREILRAGMPDLLVGLPEGPWLDAKSQDYDLGSDRGKISIAQDVARFANAESGGMIAIGIKTKRQPSGETLQ